MPFNIFDGLDALVDLLTLDFSKNSSSKSADTKKSSKKSKYTTELWSGSFLAIASILYFIVFKDPLPEENHLQTVLICILIGFLISFVLFFSLYQLGLFYFKSLFKLLLFSFSSVLFIISVVFIVYFKSEIF
ncbi:branched-chain amino acid ABC transporter substrate-binding protein [Chryseobacterium sp. Ch-15]|uniref:Branched-chain amino acid ABC transporter substrate-binding protein n=1 Tax=Chryseobacterium muglaense TaxID=2893752 RepID=A0A9Q3UUH6_9FLAO|nr:branched-chain amino acid ABC transporter substrate-binding protein [Chryseobacterium muglaense]MBD3905283.1 branched-chain amino acid ABC transporter substrate-binding protein [Chryseobacterium muglaense]MCC9033960.1 branched-chain amino acid ABC transporter substrate-binding protein [Chryseobacterium muglaense]MCM2554179.1 branched-chain amino acid ABC transporter substrate-binding protein [Chryseobacterium muglaense]